MGAVIGTGNAMQAAQETFLSSTHWTERIGPASALACVQKHRRENVAAHLMRIGESVQQVWRAAAEESGLRITVAGMAPLGRFAIEEPQPQALKTLFVQEMLERGFLASNAFYAMYAHRQEHVAAYAAAVREVFAVLRSAVDAGDVRERLRGPVSHSGFFRLA
jgi:glutamate-1-semialdehyde 2,1-aminomutase